MEKKCYHNIKLFDGRTAHLIQDQIVLTNGEKIEAIEDQAGMDKFPEYEAVDMNGLTMIPGLIDAHVHITVPSALEKNVKVILQMGKQVAMNFASFPKHGITTVRDMGAFAKKIISWRNRIESGNDVGPRVLTPLSFITSIGGVPEMAPKLNPVESLIAGGQFVERCQEPEQVRKVAERLIDQGADWLKTQYSEESFLFHGRLNNLSDACFRALQDVSKKRGVPVAMHHMDKTAFKKAVEFDFNTLEHCSFQPLDRADVDRFVAKGMAIVPTLKAMGDFMDIGKVQRWLEEQGRADFMPEPFRQTLAGVKLMQSASYPPPDYKKKFYADIDMMRRGYETALKNVALIKQAGGQVGAGTDSFGTSLSFAGQYWWELSHLKQAGFSNFEVLETATRINAEIIGLGDKIGTIEPGKMADFTFIDGDPLSDVEAISHVRRTVKGGKTVYVN